MDQQCNHLEAIRDTLKAIVLIFSSRSHTKQKRLTANSSAFNIDIKKNLAPRETISRD